MEKRKLRFVFSVDDGKADDLKIAELLLQNKLPGLFYIPSNGQLDGHDIAWLHEEGFEIGGHTSSHPPDLKMLNDRELRWEIIGNKLMLESIIGEEITKFAYPRGRYNEKVIEVVKEAGYKEARTTLVLQEAKHYDPFRTHTTIHALQRKEYKGREWDSIAREYAREYSGTSEIFHIWCHSVDLDRHNYWERLESLLDHISETYEIVAA